MSTIPLVGKVFSPIDPKLAAPAAWPELDQDLLLYPPDEWFTDEMADQAPAKLQILASGQVWGVVAPAGRCLLDGQPGCWSIPRPADGRGSALACPDAADYRMAHVGTTVLASGAEIPTATLAGAGGHHSFFSTPADPAKSEYADTNRAVARGRYVWSDTAGGQVFVGAVMPTLDEVKIAVARCSAVSVDYRWIDDEQRHVFFGSCLVNMGGLPSRYTRPVMAGAAVLVPDVVLAAAVEQQVDYEIDGEPPDGAMIALLPDNPETLAMADGEPPGSLHITMRYLGKAADWPPAARSALVAAIDEALTSVPPVEFEVAAVAQIGPNGAGALIMNGHVAELRDQLASISADTAAAEGVDLPDDHAGFIPHLTLRWDGQAPPETLIGTTFGASTIRVVFATEAHDIDLTTNHQETVMATAHTCTCGGAPKLAAYRLVDATGAPEQGAEIALPDGRTGQFDDLIKSVDGSDVYLVRLLTDGHLADYSERIAVPAADATPTGQRFEWEEDGEYRAVLAAVGDVGPSLAPTEGQQLDSRLDDLKGEIDEILAKVTDLHGAHLQQAVAGLGELPAV